MLHLLLLLIRWGACVLGVIGVALFIFNFFIPSKNKQEKDDKKSLFIFSAILAVVCSLVFWGLPKLGFYQNSANITGAEYSPSGEKPYYVHVEANNLLEVQNPDNNFHVLVSYTRDGSYLDVGDDDVGIYWTSDVADVKFKLSDQNRQIQQLYYMTSGRTIHSDKYNLIGFDN